ncbi:hypothetical protein ACLOJK_023888 [Asimina triloba]
MDDQTRGEKQVILIGIDSSLQSLYSLEWTLEHLIRTDDSYFKLVVLHVRAPAIAVLPFSSTVIDALSNKPHCHSFIL